MQESGWYEWLAGAVEGLPIDLETVVRDILVLVVGVLVGRLVERAVGATGVRRDG